MMRSLLLALALARAGALLDSPGDSTGHSPGLRGTAQSVVDEPAGQYSVRSKGRTLDFGYQDFFVGPLDDPFNDAMKAKGYVCDNTKDKVEQEIAADGLPPLGGVYPFDAGWAFANATAHWVRGVLGLNASELPLHFAFYINGNRSFDHECNKIPLKGAESCQYLKAQAVRPSDMGKVTCVEIAIEQVSRNYVLDLLEKDDLVPWLEDPKFNASVLQLAYEAFVEFVTPTCGEAGVQTSGCDKVYVPGSVSDCGSFCAINGACADYAPGGAEGTCPFSFGNSATDYDSHGFVCCCNERISEAQNCGEESPPIPTLHEFATDPVYRPFWGSSSGGGSGGSLAVKCVTKEKFPTEKILISGGGGGGGGYTSPQGVGDGLVGIAVGGGAGGGAQIGSLTCINASAYVGAGAGNHQPGVVDLNPVSSTPAEWIAQMAKVKDNMTACYLSNETDLVISGEGNSGFGFQHLVGFNQSEILQNQTLSIGFRFQFAMGQGNGSMIRDTQPPADASGVGFTGGKAYVVCERNAPGDCRDCVNPTLYPNENGTRKPNVYQCVGGIEKLVCDHWKDAFPGKPEGLYPCCMAKVEKIYKDAYDPEQLSRWRLHETTSPRRRRRALVNEQRQYRNGDVPRRYAPTPTGGPGTLQPFCPDENSTRPTEACTDPNMTVTENMIRTKGWCPTPKELKDMMLTDCPPLPGCEGYPEDYYTSCYDKCLEVGYTDAFCVDANVACDDTKKNCFSGQVCSTTASTQQCLDANGGVHNAQKGPCNY